MNSREIADKPRRLRSRPFPCDMAVEVVFDDITPEIPLPKLSGGASPPPATVVPRQNPLQPPASPSLLWYT